MKTQVSLVRRSICPCGYGVLHDDIALGTLYTIDLASVRSGFAYGCGRCGMVQRNVRVVNASSVKNPDAPLRPMPFDLFEQPVPTLLMNEQWRRAAIQSVNEAISAPPVASFIPRDK